MSGAGRAPQMMALGLSALPSLATLGEGGAAINSLLAWHAWLLLLVLWVLLAPVEGEEQATVAASAPLIAAALFLVLASLGAVFAPYFFAAWLTLLELAACLALLLLAARSGMRLLPLLRRMVVLVAAAQGLLALYQRLVLEETRPAGTFLNPNYLACWLAVALILSAGAWRRELPLVSKVAGIGLAAPAAAALVLSGSRGGLLALGAGLLWLLCRCWSDLRPAERRLFVASMLLGIVLVGWRMAGRLQEDDPFRYQRLDIWKASAAMVMDDPWWGCGPGQFPFAATGHQFADGNGPLQYDRAFRIPHSDVIRLFSEFGIPAALALLAALALAMRAIFLRRHRDAGAQAALLAIGCQALVDDPSHWPAIYLLSVSLFGCLLAAPSPAPARLPRPLRSVLAALLLLMFAVGDLGPAAAHIEASKLPARDLDPEQSKHLAFALRLNPLQPDYRRRQAEALAGGSAALTLEKYATARESAETAIRLNPADGLNHWMAAKVERRACLELFRDIACRERVTARYRWAQALKPYDVRVSIDHGQFLLAAGDPDGARRCAERALTMEPEGVAARILLAEILLRQRSRDRRGAAELVREAQALASRHAAAAGANEYSRQMLSLDQRRLGMLLREGEP
jgi:O-antigen ligase/Tfp pilus assembly protein PilF